MRTDEERAMNKPFLLFTVEVEGYMKPFNATALAMRDAAAWCDNAKEFQRQFVTDMDGGDFIAAMDLGIDALKAYANINQGNLVPWEKLTADQITTAVGTLLDVNDPFTHARNRRAEKEAEQIKAVSLVKEMGLDSNQIERLIELQKR